MLAEGKFKELKEFLDRMERTFNPIEGYHQNASGLMHIILDGIEGQSLTQEEINDQKRFAYEIAEEGYRRNYLQKQYAKEIAHLSRLMMTEQDRDVKSHYEEEIGWKREMQETATEDTFTCMLLTYGLLKPEPE